MKRNNRSINWVAIAGISLVPALFPSNSVWAEQIVSKSFELRYFSTDPQANGETDFKGPTEVFDTAQRIEYLRRYAEYAGRFFDNAEWNKQVVSNEDVRAAVATLKPQPLPTVRRRILLTDWKYLGCRPGQRVAESRELETWTRFTGVSVRDSHLEFVDERSVFSKPIEQQKWRMFLSWRVKTPTTRHRVSFALSKAAVVGFNEQGNFFYTTNGREVAAGPYRADTWYEFKVEIDLDKESRGYNFYIDGKRKADFVQLAGAADSVDSLTVEGVRGTVIDDVWGVGYTKPEYTSDNHTRDVPYAIKTFIDEDFEVRPTPVGFETVGYDDSRWQPVPQWPYAHGGERHAGEDLYLRTTVRVGAFDRAVLNLECLDPAGDVWVNGKVVAVEPNRHPAEIDLTKFLKPNADNLIAVHVRPFKVEHTMRHTPSDLYTGWFAGRMSLDLTAGRYIDDVFMYTKSLADNATMQVQITLHNNVWAALEREVKTSSVFSGRVTVRMYPWFPQQSPTAAATATFPVSLDLGQELVVSDTVEVPQPQLWWPDNPHLYKVVVTLEDQNGTAIDDYVITTGIRTVSQEGGTFRINGKPAMMNGALLFGFRSPLDKIAQWLRCSPTEWLVRDIMMLKNMNGNTARMSQHDGPARGINDPRFAEIGDQLGIMFQWGTTAWVRTGSPWQLDFDGLPKYVRQVRNHPSIVIWQPGNHPKFNGFESSMPWFKKVYDTIYAEDPSRLICPTANIGRLDARNDDGTLDKDGNPVKPIPVWTAPMIVRGNMDNATGYGANWEPLRKWPYPKKWDGEQGWRATGFKTDYLNSKYRAYFNFENEESAGQPNWTLRKGKPSYQIKSYEITYDKGSIGRELSVGEWKLSQAWQAFSAYEAIRKMRWLDYDGFAWCTLRGGGNTATYEKPLIDYYGYGKMAFYTVKMAYQSVLAGSGNVDMVYGPNDKTPVVVMNLGKARTATVLVVVRDMNGKEVSRKTYSNVNLPAGRSCTTLPAWQPEVPSDGHYAIEYTVLDTSG
ncbi:MAG: hypothetical protein J7M12_01250 [Candidatus Hydrogenedentes bacterium]|nr:hypothetical protein [Candidatus Hydrogenedentota bacterium]